MAPEPQGLGRQRKIARMVAVRRKSDRPAVIFSVISDGQTRYPIVTQNENPIEDREKNSGIEMRGHFSIQSAPAFLGGKLLI